MGVEQWEDRLIAEWGEGHSKARRARQKGTASRRARARARWKAEEDMTEWMETWRRTG